MKRRIFLARSGAVLGTSVLAAACRDFEGPLEAVDYTFVFPDPSGRNGEPDPLV